MHLHGDVLDFCYAAVGRLISESTNGTPTSYSYDANGNRLNNNSVYDAQDRLVENTDFQFFYDKSGFLIEKRRKSDNQSIFYTYYSFGRLLKVDDRINNKVIEFTVDPEGRRLVKKVNGILARGWIYKDAFKPVGELEYVYGAVPHWDLKKVFINGTNPYVPDAIVSVSDNKTYRMINDHLGSPRMVVDANSGEVVQEMDYDTWGNVVSDTSPGLTPFGFAGGLYDPDTGLVRFGARDYDPSIGRWLDKDPIGFVGGVNWYVYVGNDSINYTDPFGLTEADVQKALIIASQEIGGFSPKTRIIYTSMLRPIGIDGIGIPGGPIFLPNEYQEQLSDMVLGQMFSTILHEAQHQVDPLHTITTNAFTNRHEEIQKNTIRIAYKRWIEFLKECGR